MEKKKGTEPQPFTPERKALKTVESYSKRMQGMPALSLGKWIEGRISCTISYLWLNIGLTNTIINMAVKTNTINK